MTGWRVAQWRFGRIPVLLGVMVLIVMACSGDGGKNGKNDEHKQQRQITDTAPQGQWIAVPPNSVWVPQGTVVQPPPSYYAPSPPPVDSGGYGRRGYEPPQYSQPNQRQPGYIAPAPSGNPWAVPQQYGSASRDSRWGTPNQGKQWQAPIAQPQFRPLDEERPAYTREPARQTRNASPWKEAAPYDRPYGSSANPGYPGAPYGGYPGYGGGVGGYAPGTWPGGYGYGAGWPVTGGMPGMVPGVW